MKSEFYLWFLVIAVTLVMSGQVPAQQASQATSKPEQKGGDVANGLKLNLACILPQDASEEAAKTGITPGLLGKHAYYGVRFQVQVTNVGKVAVKFDNYMLLDGLSIRLQAEDGAFVPDQLPARYRTPIRAYLYLAPGATVDAERLYLWGRVARPAKEGKYQLWIETTTKLQGAEKLKDSPDKANSQVAIWTGNLKSNRLEMLLPPAPTELSDDDGRRVAARVANESLAKLTFKALDGSLLPAPQITPEICGGMGYMHDRRQFYFELPKNYGKHVRIQMFFDGSRPSIRLE